MELLIICAIVLYAFLWFAPDDLIKACLATAWLLMILVMVGTTLYYVVSWAAS